MTGLDWERIRTQLAEAVGESTFAIWLDPIELLDRIATVTK
jgi:hypothetical protein